MTICRIWCTNIVSSGSPDGVLVERRTHDRKVASSNPGRSGGGIFFSRVNFLCWLLFCVRSTPVLPQWHVKDPGHSAISVGGRLDLNTHTPLTQRSRSGLTLPLSRHSEGTYQETGSHATPQGTLVHSHLNSLSQCGPILAYWLELVCASRFPLFKKKAQLGSGWQNIFSKSSQARKMPPTP